MSEFSAFIAANLVLVLRLSGYSGTFLIRASVKFPERSAWLEPASVRVKSSSSAAAIESAGAKPVSTIAVKVAFESSSGWGNIGFERFLRWSSFHVHPVESFSKLCDLVLQG